MIQTSTFPIPALHVVANTTAGADNTVTVRGGLDVINDALQQSILHWKGFENYWGQGAISVTVDDLGNSGSSPATPPPSSPLLTILVTVTSVNDAPTISIPNSHSYTVAEDSVLSLSGITIEDGDFSDPNLPNEAKLTVSVVASVGNLTPPASISDVSFMMGSLSTPSTTILFSGKLADVNLLLDGLTYSPPKDYNSVESAVAPTITFSVNDQGNTGASASPLTGEATLQVFVSSVNDDPIIIDDFLSYPVNVNEGNATNLGSNLEVLDVDEEYLLTLTMACTSLGTVSLSKPITKYPVHASQVTSTSITVGGTLTNVNDVLSDLIYTSERGEVVKGTEDTLTITVEEGPTSTVTKTLQLKIVNAPTAPELTAPKALFVDENVEQIIAGVIVNDVDLSLSDAIQISVSAASGSVTISPPAATHTLFTVGSPSTPSPILTLKASVSDMALILPTLAYTTAADYSSSAYIQDTVTITATDVNTSPVQGTVTTTIVTVTGASSPPTINADASPITTSEDTELTFTDNAVSFNSVTNINELHTVTLQTTFGKIKLGSTVGIHTISGANTYRNKVEFSGSIKNCNNAVTAMKYSPASKYVGSDKVEVTIEDEAGLTSIAELTIEMIEVNDPPVINLPTGQTIDEDSTYSLGSVSVTDEDSTDLELDVSVIYGTIETPSDFTVVSSTSSLGATFRGTLQEINDALEFSFFRPSPDFNSIKSTAMAAITFTAKDTKDGIGTTQTLPIFVNPVNDAPDIISPDHLSVSTTVPSDLYDISISDVDASDDGGSGLLTLMLEASKGSISLGSLSGLAPAIPGGQLPSLSSPQAVVSILGTLESINKALMPITYHPDLAASYTSTETVTVTLNDEGNSGNPSTPAPLTTTKVVLLQPASTTSGEVPTLTFDENSVFSTLEDTTFAFADFSLTSPPGLGAESEMNYYTEVTSSASRSYFTWFDAPSDVIITPITSNPVVGGTTKVSLKGLPSALSLFLSSELKLNPESDYAGLETVVFQTSTSLPGSSTVTNAVNIEIIPVNDPPTVISPYSMSSSPLNVQQNVKVAIPSTSVLDVDTSDAVCATANGIMTVTVTFVDTSSTSLLSIKPSSQGGLELSSADALTGASSITIRGTQDALNAGLDNLYFISGSEDVKIEEIAVTVDDEGNCGGPSTSASSSIFLNVHSFNDPPTIASSMLTMAQSSRDPTSAHATNEDTPTTLSAITVSDDEPTKPLTVKLTVEHGTLELASQTAIKVHDGYGAVGKDIYFDAAPSEATNALTGLLYTPDADFNDQLGVEKLTVSIIDSGFNEVQEVYRVSVVPINDAPVIVVPSFINIVEDIETIVTPSITVSDVDEIEEAPLDCGLLLTVLATRGTVRVESSIAANNGVSLSSTSASHFLRMQGSAENLNKVLGTLFYTTASNDDAADTLVVSISDNSCTESASLRNTEVIAVEASSVFDAPTITNADTAHLSMITIYEDSPTLLPALPIISPDTISSSSVSFSISTDLGGLVSLKTEDGITLHETTASQTITASSTQPSGTVASPEVQIIRTYIPFQYEIQRFTIATGEAGVGFEITHNGLTELAVIDTVESTSTVASDLKYAIELLRNVGKVKVSHEGTVGNDDNYLVTFFSNDGDIPAFTHSTGFSAKFACTEVKKGTTTTEVQKVEIMSDAALTAGQFQLGIHDSDKVGDKAWKDDSLKTAILDYDSSDSDIASAITNLNNVKLAKVTAIDSNAQLGSKYRSSWDITFAAENMNRPIMAALWNGNSTDTSRADQFSCSGCTAFSGNAFTVVNVKQVSQGSELLNGNSNFKLRFDGYSHQSVATTVSIPADISASGMEAVLESLENLEKVSVTRSSETPEGVVSWTITFDKEKHPGDLPSLEVSDTSEMSGTSYVYASTLTNGKATLGGGFTVRITEGVNGALSEPVTIPVGSSADEVKSILGNIAYLKENNIVVTVSKATGTNSAQSVSTYFSQTSYTTSFKVNFTPAGPSIALHSDSLTGNDSRVAISSSSSLSERSNANTFKVRTAGSNLASVDEVQDLICQTTGSTDTFTISFRGETTGAIKWNAAPVPTVLPACCTTGSEPSCLDSSVQPCNGDGSSLKEQLEALSSVSSVSIFTTTDATMDSTAGANNANACSDITDGFKNVNRITFTSADDAVGDIEMLTVVEAWVAVSERVKGAAPSIQEVQIVSTSADNPADLDGSFTLSFMGAKSGSISVSASDLEMKSALEVMTTIGDVEVSKRRGPGTTAYIWSITFISSGQPTHMGNQPLITVTSNDCGAYGCNLEGTNAAVSVQEIVNGTSPLWGNFTLKFESNDGSLVETTTTLAHDCTAEEMQAAIQALSLGNAPSVSARYTNGGADYGFVWDVSLNDGGVGKMSLGQNYVFGNNITYCNTGDACADTCSSKTVPFDNIGRFNSSAEVVAMCNAKDESADPELYNWCNSVFSTSSTSSVCTPASWAGCAACTDFTAPKIVVTSSKSTLSGEGSLASVNEAFKMLVYSPATNFHSAFSDYDTITISLKDSLNAKGTNVQTSTYNMKVDIQPVNDAPAVSAPSTFSVGEDTEARIDTISVSDVDLVDGYHSVLPVTLTLSANHGTIGLYSTTGLEFVGGSTSIAHAHKTMTISGTIDSINKALNPLSYMPDVNWNSYDSNTDAETNFDSLSVTVHDGGNIGQGTSMSAISTIQMFVTADNDAPEVAVPSFVVSFEEDTTLKLEGLVFLTDPDDTVLEVSIFSSRGGISYDESGVAEDTGITVVGSTASVNTKQDGLFSSLTLSGSNALLKNHLDKIVFTPDENFNGVTDVVITAKDGSAAVSVGTIRFNIQSVNDAPTVSSPGAILCQSGISTLVGGITVDDVDVSEEWDSLLTVSMSTSQGTLSMDKVGKKYLTQFLSGDGDENKILEFSGGVNAITTALSKLSYKSDAGFVGQDAIDVTVKDGRGGECAGTTIISVLASTGEFDVKVPDAFSYGKPIEVEEDSVWVAATDLEKISISNPDGMVNSASDVVTVAISCSYGGVSVQGSTSYLSEISISDVFSQASSKIGTLSYKPDANWNGLDVVTITVSGDNASTKTTRVLFLVKPVNDSPQIAYTAGAGDADGKEGEAMALGSFSILDVDAAECVGNSKCGGGLVQIKASAPQGQVMVEDIKNVILHACEEEDPVRSWMSTLCFQSTVDDANTALQNMQYKPNYNSDGTHQISIEVDDLGNCDRGTDAGLVDTVTIDIVVSKASIVPHFVLSQTTFSMDEEASVEIFATLHADMGSDAAITLSIASSSGGGVALTNDDISGVTVVNDGSTLSLTGSPSVLSSAFTGISGTGVGIVYFPKNNFNGIEDVTFSSSYVDQDVVVNMAVRAVNDAPVLSFVDAGVSSLTIDEGTPANLKLVKAEDVDCVEFDGGTLEVEVYAVDGVGAVVTSGNVHIPGVWVSTNSDATGVVLKGGVGATNDALTGTSDFLVYNPPVDYHGSASVAYVVSDLGNSGSGGALFATLVHSITIVEVHDAPTITFSSSRSHAVEDISSLLNVDITVAAKEIDGDGLKIVCNLNMEYGELTGYSDIDVNWGSDGNYAVGGTSYKYRVEGVSSKVSQKLGEVIYNPPSNFNGLDVLQIVCSDGTMLSEAGSLNVVVSSVNDAPSVVLPSNIFAFDEDSSVTLSAATGVYVVDPDAHERSDGMIELVVSSSLTECTFTLPTNGNLAGLKATLGADSTSLTVQGTVSNVNAGVGNIELGCSLDFSGSGTLTYSVLDDHGDSEGDQVASFTVVDVNDAPKFTFSASISGGLTSSEDTMFVIENLVAVADPDATATEKLRVRMVVGSGAGGFVINSGTENYLTKFSLNVVEADSIITLNEDDPSNDYGNDVYASLVIEGTLAGINGLFSAPLAFWFSPAQDYFGTGLGENGLTFTATDGLGASTTRYLNLVVDGVNDAPVVVLAGEIAVVEDIAFALTGLLTVHDVDLMYMPNGQAPSMSISLTPVTGTIGLSTPVQGCYVTSASGITQSSTFSFRGGVEVINSVMEKLVYTTCADCDEDDEIVVVVDDEGNYGSDGGAAKVTVLTAPVSVATVNDAPRIIQPTKFKNEGDDFDLLKVSFENLMLKDPDENVGDKVTITMSVVPSGAGTIELVDRGLGGAGVEWLVGKGYDDEVVTFETTTALANAMFARVLFNGDAGASSSSLSSAVIAMRVEDKEGAVVEENVVLNGLITNTENNAPTVNFSGVSDGDLAINEGEVKSVGVISVSDVDAEESPNSYLEVSVSTYTGGSLEVQTVETDVESRFPVWVIQTTATSALGGTFILDINGACQTDPIHVTAVAKKEFENSASTVTGQQSGQSIESILSKMTCLQALGITVEVFRDEAGAGQVNTGLVSANNDGSHADANGGHIWKVTFVGAEQNEITLSVLDVLSLSGTSAAVSVVEGLPANHLAGDFTLKLGSTYISTPIKFDADEKAFSDALHSMESVKSVKVTRSLKDIHVGSYIWTVTFLSMGEGLGGGNMPKLQVASNNLKDTDLTKYQSACAVMVKEVKDGYGRPSIWNLETNVGQTNPPHNRIVLEGDGLHGSFTFTLSSFGTTGPIYQDTVAMASDEGNRLTRDDGLSHEASYPDGMNTGQSIESLVAALPGWESSTMSVQVTRAVRVSVGVKTVQWDVNFNGVDHTTFSALTLNGGTAGASASFNLQRTDDPMGLSTPHPIGGTFDVMYGETGHIAGSGSWTTSTLQHSASEDDVKNALTTMMGGSSVVDLEVARVGPNLHGGYTWTVAMLRGPKKFFLSSANGGTSGALVADGSKLTGVGAYATTSEVRRGGEEVKLGLSTRSLGGVYFPKSERRGVLVDGVSSSDTITMRGSLASLNEALSKITVHTPIGYHGDLYLNVWVSDMGFSGAGGTKTAESALKILVNDISNEAVITYNGARLTSDETIVSGLEDTVFKFINDGVSNVDMNYIFQVENFDVGVGDFSVKVYANHGTVSALEDGHLNRDGSYVDHDGVTHPSSVGEGISGTATVGVTISGPLSVVNAALKTLSYKPDWNWWGHDDLTFEVKDAGGLLLKTRQVHLDVKAVNDFPTVVVEGEGTLATQLMTDPSSWQNIVRDAVEDIELAIDFLSIYDTDNLDLYKDGDSASTAVESLTASAVSSVQQVLEVELAVSNGVLSVFDKHTFGVSVISSNGGRILALRGLQKMINSALKHVRYLGDLNWNGDDTLIVTATDFGVYAGSEEVNALTHVRHVILRVAEVNDVPYVVLPTTGRNVLEALEDVGGIIGSPCADGTIAHAGGCDQSNLDLSVVAGEPVHYMSTASFYVRDDDATPSEVITLDIIVTHGTITLRDLSTVPSLSFTVGDGTLDGTLTVSGTVADLNVALKGAVFLSDKNFNSEHGHLFPIDALDSGMAKITFTCTDAMRGTTTVVQNIDVQATNDLPVVITELDVYDPVLFNEDGGSELRSSVATLQVFEDVPYRFTSVSVRDVDCAQTLVEGLVLVTIYASKGTVSVPENSPVQLFVVGEPGQLVKTLSFKGSVKNVNVALSQLEYLGDKDIYGADTLIIEVADEGNNGYSMELERGKTVLKKGVVKTDSITIPIALKSEVDAPVISVPNQPVINEDTANKMVGVSIVDVDGSGGDIHVSIVCNNGYVKLNTFNGISLTTGTGVLDAEVVMTGPLADCNKAIEDFTYLPKQHWHTEGRDLDECVITVDDLGLNDPEGDHGVSTKTLYIQVLPVNDKPEWRIPGQVWKLPPRTKGYVVDYVKTSDIDEDQDLVLNGVKIIDHDLKDDDRSDVDSVVTVKMTCSSGTIKLGSTEGLWLLGGSDKSASVKFQATLENANKALTGLTYRGLQDYNGADSIYFEVDDMGNYGQGGALLGNATLPIAVNAINDSPLWDVPNFPVVCPEDYQCEIANIKIVDPDATEYTSNGFDVTISADFGTVNLAGLEVPMSINFILDDGEGSGTARMTGNMADVNFMLDGLVYTPPEDMTTLNSANDVIHLLISSDGGNPGLTAVGRIMVVVAEGNNDAPIIKYTEATYIEEANCESEDIDYSEDASLLAGGTQSTAPASKQCSRLISVNQLDCTEDVKCPIAGITVEDKDAVEIDYHVMQVTISATNGNIVLENATSFDIWWGEGVAGVWPKGDIIETMTSPQHKVVFQGRLDVINNALESLLYISDPHYFGVDTIVMEVNDLGFWGGGGSKTTEMTIPVFVEGTEDKAMMIVKSISVKATEDAMFVLPGVSVVHADSDAGLAIKHFADAADVTSAFDGSNVPVTTGAGLVRVMVGCEGVRVRFAADAGLAFTTPKVTSEETRKHQWGYVNANPSDLETEAGLTSPEGVDLGVTSGAPKVLFWKNTTIEGRLADVNAALYNLLVLGDENYDRLGSITLSVKSLGVDGGGENTESRVKDWHWEYDDSRTVYVDVKGVNDEPVITITGLESYAGTNLLVGDSLSQVVTSIDTLTTYEEEQIAIPFSVRDVDDADAILTVTVTATRGYVSLEDPQSLLFKVTNDPSGDHQTFTISGEIADINAVFTTLKFTGKKDYYGSGASVEILASDGNSLNNAKVTVNIIIKPLNDPISLILGTYSEDQNTTYFVDEGEAVRIGGATLRPDKFEPLGIGIVGNKEYSTKTGYELFRMEGAEPDYDSGYGWGSGDDWRGKMVKDINDGDGSSDPRFFEEFNGGLYFSAFHKDSGRELFFTNGLKTGTHMLKDIFPGSRGSDPQYMTVFSGDNQLYFSATGVDIEWMVDPHLADSCGGFRQSTMDPKVFYAVSESNVWESSRDYDCPYGYHWASTAEMEGRFTANLDKVAAVGEGRVYSSECDWTGYTWGGVSRKHFRMSDSRVTGAYMDAGNYDGVQPFKDGTTMAPTDGELTKSEFAGIVCIAGEPVGNDFYAECSSEINSKGGFNYESSISMGCWQRGGRSLWRTDGTQEGTVRVDSAGTESSMRGTDPKYLVEFSGDLFYSARSDEGGRELWSFDGTTASEIKDLWTGTFSGSPEFLTECNGELFFSASSGTSQGTITGRELFKSDGTGAGTVLVKEIRNGVEGSDVRNLVCVGTTLFFSADDGINGAELWSSDGTSLGTSMVANINTSGSSNPQYLTSYNSKVVFAADNGVEGVELWESSGTGASIVQDVRKGSGSSFPTGLTVFTTSNTGATSKLYFLAVDGSDVGGARSSHSWGAETYGMHLWNYDGTTVTQVFLQTYGTVDIDKESLDADFPADFGIFSNTLYYSANEGKRDIQVPSGFPERDLTSYERVHGFDQAFVLYDDDVNYDSNHVYQVELGVTKGEIEVVDLSLRGASLSFSGTLKQINQYAKRVLFYPTTNENGWAEVTFVAKDLVNQGDCDELDICEEQTLSGQRSIWITAVNDAPVLTYIGGAVSTSVGQEVVVSLQVADEDVGDGLMAVEVTTASGRIKLDARDGITFDGVGERGQGYESDVKFYGKLDSVNEALSQISYVCDSCTAGNTDQVTVTVSDMGGTGRGGILSDVKVVQVNLS